MNVPRLRLQKAVQIDGWGVRGWRKSFLRFTPYDQPGWYWRPHPKAEPVPINRSIASTVGRTRSLMLKHRDHELNIYEHIGCLRFTGLDGVILESTTKRAFRPPYHGRALELWQALQPHTEPDGTELEWVHLKKPVQAFHPKELHRTVAAKPLEPDQAPGFYASVLAGYVHLGPPQSRMFQIPGEDLVAIFSELTPGLPLKLKLPYPPMRTELLARFGRKTHLWPHYHCVNWGINKPRDVVLREFIGHRFQDLLGAFSVVDHQKLPAMNVDSYMGGHLIDMDVIHRMELV